MKEDFLHYVWQFRKFAFESLETTAGLPVTIHDPGTHNLYAGPDFFNSRIRIGGQLWAGNVEIHINSSDWYAHGHESDTNYDSVILHVVWNHNQEVCRKDNSTVPVLELKHVVDKVAHKNYEALLKRPLESWINCQKDFADFDSFRLNNWLERLFFERLEEKYEVISHNLTLSANNWEEVFFRMMCKNFGLNLNGDAFLQMAGSFPFSLVLKLRDQVKLEALFLGQAGMLEEDLEMPYYRKLQEEYLFLKKKYDLINSGRFPVKYFRLRPDNFPTIRLAQLAALYANQKTLFSRLLNARTLEEIQKIMEVDLSPFWETHYTFEKDHNFKKKNFSSRFIELLIINTLVPVKFVYSKYRGLDANEEIVEIMSSLKLEENQIVKKFTHLRPKHFSGAFHSQALLHLKKNYCDKNLCLKCSLGTNLLERKTEVSTFERCSDL